MTGPHDPEEHPRGEEEPWYGTGYDDEATASHPGGYGEGSAAPDASSEHPDEYATPHGGSTWTGGTPSSPGSPQGPTDPPTQPGTLRGPGVHPTADEPATVRSPATEAPRSGWWRSRRVRVGAAATLAGLVLLGGGFGAGYAVADASAPPAAAHATAAKGAGQGTAAQARRRQAAQRRQHRGGAATPGAGAGAGPGTGTAPGATAGAPTF